MAIKTKVTWGNDATAVVNVQVKERKLIVDGTTDGTSEAVDGAIVRIWTTREAAQEWIDFLNSHTPAPAEAVIVEE